MLASRIGQASSANTKFENDEDRARAENAIGDQDARTELRIPSAI